MFNLFKKQRSAWLEGLLFAERCVQSGQEPTLDIHLEMTMWQNILSLFKQDFNFGLIDYLDYYQENLEVDDV